MPVPVLDPGRGRTATGYLWAYRSGPCSERQAVLFEFAANRSKAAPNRFLKPFQGTLVVDGYVGYADVIAKPGVIEAACMAHARRGFFEVWEATRSPAAQTALATIAKLYNIERQLHQADPIERAAQRQARAGPILKDFHTWLKVTLGQVPPHQRAVRNGVEVVGQIGVDDFTSTPIGNAEVSATQGHLRVHARAKAALPRQQVHFEDWTDHQEHSHLRHSIPDRRDAERPFTTTRFRDPHAQQRLRRVLLRHQLPPQCFQPRSRP
jgi:hypothetical protein